MRNSSLIMKQDSYTPLSCLKELNLYSWSDVPGSGSCFRAVKQTQLRDVEILQMDYVQQDKTSKGLINTFFPTYSGET
jgi:hypothetical protein